MAYRIDISEAAEAEMEAAFLWISRKSPEGAGQWYAGLLRAIESLAEMPHRCPVARESDRFDSEIRQLLYGRGRTAYRVLFLVIEPGASDDQPAVRILHVRHGAKQHPE